MFWAAAVPGALCVIVALFGIREIGHREHSEASQKNRSGEKAGPDSSSFRNLPGAFYLVLSAVTLFSIGNSSDMFLVMRAQNAGVPVSLAPLLGLVFNITYTLGSWPAGWFSDRYPRRKIAATGYVIFAVVYFVFGLAPSTHAIWITMAIYGVYYALTQPVLKALIVESVHPGVQGQALGIYFFATSVAALAASLITGQLWKHYGASVPFYFSAALAVVATLLLLITSKGN